MHRVAAWLLLGAGLLSSRGESQTAPPLRPMGIAYNANGDLFIADAARNVIEEISVGGVVLIVAGNGVQGFAGDGGAATAAMLNRPAAVAVAGDGTLLIADTGNQRIRSVAPNGTITTIAGDGQRRYAGDNGPATQASLCEPSGVALAHDGSLRIADRCNARVRAVTAGGMSTVAGDGMAGFSGDGASAVSAELNEPQAVAFDASGRLLIADTRNHRVRIVAADGTISTVAGNGIRGFAGDGGAATQAELALPDAVVAIPAGFWIADAENHRLRLVDSHGTISTLVGNGVQGSTADGALAFTTPLNRIAGLAMTPFGAPVFSDAATPGVFGLLVDGRVYAAASLVPRSTTVSLGSTGGNVGASSLPPQVYGASSVAVAVSGSAATPLGTVVLQDGGAAVTTASLQNGQVNFSPRLSAGPHALVALYSGDGFNPSGASAVSTLVITQAPVVATANAVNLVYAQPVPTLTGSSTGILAQDQASESVVFTTTAQALSPAGVYPITASLAGPASADYALTMSPTSGSLTIAQAPTTSNLLAGAGYAGLPLSLIASVQPAYGGVPTGTVAFQENGSTVATATVSGGRAAGVYLAPTSGSHTLTATYSGDTDFLPSTSAPTVATVGALPDFTIAAQRGASQTVTAGTVATYSVIVTPASPAFSSTVSISVSGLPNNTAVAITPSLLIPAAGGTTLTVAVPTQGLLAMTKRSDRMIEAALFSLALLMVPIARRRRLPATWAIMASVLLATATGCGARTVPEASSIASKTFTIHVTGTSTSLAGSILSHSVDLSLTVE